MAYEPQNPNKAAMVADLFDAAMDLPVAEWDAFLDQTGVDPEVRHEVRRLLAVTDEAADFFERLAADIQPLREYRPRLEAGQVLDRKFRILRFVARGGMGEVYEAEHLILGGHVAVKVMALETELHSGAFEAFRAEINHARPIKHANVCQVYEVYRTEDPSGGDLVYFTMEFLAGESLWDRIERGPLPLAESAALIRQMADGLDAAHRFQVLHRDFKSANVMVCPPTKEGSLPRAVVMDFGLAGSLAGNTAARADGVTRAYAPPEHPVSMRESDVYSFGVVMYEMLTGELPFDPDAAGPRKKPRSPRSLRPEIPRKWEACILRCLEADPKERYASAGEAATEMLSRVQPWWFAAGACAALVLIGLLLGRLGPVAVPPSLAVLPFAVEREEDRYLAEGVADRVTDSLSKVPGLRIISRVAVAHFPSAGDDFTATAEKFHVRYLLVGSLRKVGVRYRVSTELVEASTGTDLWSEAPELGEQELDGLSARVVRAAIQKLNLMVGMDQQTALGRRLTDNPEAYKHYVLGRYYASLRSPQSLRDSVALLEKAVALDPGFAAAQAALAYAAWDFSIRNGADWQRSATRSVEAARRAVAMEPNSVLAHLALGLFLSWREYDWAGAERELRKALDANPSSADAHRQLALLLGRLGRSQEALVEIGKAVDLDPLYSAVHIARGTLLLYSGAVDRSLAEYRSVVSSEPGNHNVYVPMSDALLAKGLNSEAAEAVERAVAISERESFAISALGRIYGLMGRTAEARGIAAELESRYRVGTATAIEVAYPYLGLGAKDEAFRWMDLGVLHRDFGLLALKVAPEFEGLRGDSRYAGLLARMKLYSE